MRITRTDEHYALIVGEDKTMSIGLVPSLTPEENEIIIETVCAAQNPVRSIS
jgi:hypothetical protein